MEPVAADSTATSTSLIHVYPLFGRDHEMTVSCWCQPERDEFDSNVIVHHIFH